ncbi:MAG: pimeloyl-CoA dehydrogenase large subunit [Variovorax paradoxus]|uniref:Pimeloyl-CoA dehydrogenase large subunit n=1 Tax=Variovorax paradoxus TaxID=34073 RepID=A0A2W5QLR4_VARPD|nr:MAG: pimeloyl-CoA dehydrogenase large subunit [Variovorax paradoxus]
MDLNPSPQEEAFRAEVRSFVSSNLPDHLRAKITGHRVLEREDYLTWHRILAAKGWLAPGWPVEFGGTGWTPVQIHIFEEELDLAGAPRVAPFGPKMVAPVIIAFGTQAQKEHYLPRILSGEDFWCQGYSEPNAGSDLAGVKMRAELHDDGFVVNGQKTWTTLAQHANKIFCLVRTDSSAIKQKGISFLLIDMNTPGISVRPIITLDGEHEVNEVFFDNVRVPRENLVGELNAGWTYAKYLLSHERFGIAQVGRSKRELALLKRIVHGQVGSLFSSARSALLNERIATVEIDLLALEYTNLRLVSEAQAGGKIGAQPSILKIKGSELAQSISELLVEALGPRAVSFVDPAVDTQTSLDAELREAAAITRQYLNWRKISIFGGTNEVQKNILSKAVLGL